MEILEIEKQFNTKICEQIDIEAESENRFKIYTPFIFSDGDHISITLKRENNQWLLTDEGNTYMHLSILGIKSDSLEYGVKHKILSGILEEFTIRDRFGELILAIQDNNFASDLLRFSQALIKISNLTYLSRDRIKQSFLEEFKDLIIETLPTERCTFNWHNQEEDLTGKYSVDCKVNSMQKPLMIFALQNEQKTLSSVITILKLKGWSVPFFPIGIYRNEEKVSSKAVAKFGDVCEKTFSNLEDDETRQNIISYLREKANV